MNTQIATGLARIGTVLRAGRWEQAELAGVTPTQSQILAYLAARGPARLATLAGDLAVSEPTASDAAAALARKGLVERCPDPKDGRARLFAATADGRVLAEQVSSWPDVVLGAIGALDEAEQAAFLRGLVKMIASLQARGAIPTQRMCLNCSHFRPNAHADAARPHHCAFVDAAFGDAALRIDCSEHQEAGAGP